MGALMSRKIAMFPTAPFFFIETTPSIPIGDKIKRSNKGAFLIVGLGMRNIPSFKGMITDEFSRRGGIKRSH